MLKLPPLLLELIDSGRWPRNRDDAIKQNLKSLASPENIQLLASDESTLYLLAPPFHTVREKSVHNKFWFDPSSVPSGIDFDLAIDIGDFGLGSDAPILLDYRESLSHPRVIRLKWSGHGKNNEWVRMADSFSDFVTTLGI